MKFVGREFEIKRIMNFFEQEEMQAALVYGRRRIGKTELIKYCIEKQGGIGIYYECKRTSEVNNIDGLAEVISEKLDVPPLAFRTFENALEFIFKRSEMQTVVFVLDEYPYVRSVIDGMDSILQALIDKYKKTAKIKFIVCGSYVETMQSLLLKSEPLYGRFDLVIDLKPMDYFESALFYPSFSDEDKVRLYSVFGGVPFYNRLIDSKKTVRQNIIDLIASPNARLENEIPMHLRFEISRINSANEVFETLAKGYCRFNDILSQSHVANSPTLAEILERLQKMELVKRVAPINDEGNKKKSGYEISDQLSLFYYKYVFRNLSRLNVMSESAFYKKFIERDFEERYVPKAFERICAQYLARKNRAGELKVPFEKLGKYWYDLPKEKRNGEFDIVAESDGQYTFYEAKFRDKPLDEGLILSEIQQVQMAGLFCEKYGFFSKSGFEKIPPSRKKNLILISLKDLYRK